MWRVDAVHKECRELREQKRNIQEEIRGIYQALPSADILEKIRIESRLKDLEQKKQGLELKEGKLRIDQLFHSLLYIDYAYQTSLFRHLSKKKHQAFVLYNSPELDEAYFSLRFLQLRLRWELTNGMESKVISFDLAARNSRRKDVPSWWRQLGAEFSFDDDLDTEDIAELVADHLKTKNVILVLDNIDFLHQQDIQALLEGFWSILAQKVSICLSKDAEGMLMAFFIDYSGVAKNWNIGFIESIDFPLNIAATYAPLSLPVVGRFSHEDIKKWIESHARNFPSDLSDYIDTHSKIEFVVDELLSKSDNGVPDQVISHICKLCHVPTEGFEAWLRG